MGAISEELELLEAEATVRMAMNRIKNLKGEYVSAGNMQSVPVEEVARAEAVIERWKESQRIVRIAPLPPKE